MDFRPDLLELGYCVPALAVRIFGREVSKPFLLDSTDLQFQIPWLVDGCENGGTGANVLVCKSFPRSLGLCALPHQLSVLQSEGDFRGCLGHFLDDPLDGLSGLAGNLPKNLSCGF